MPKVCLTSDLHGSLPTLPECDILVIAGDICPDFFRINQRTGVRLKGEDAQAIWLRKTFLPWLRQQPVGRTVAIAGNHDFVFQNASMVPDEFYAEVSYLRDREITLDGLRIYGTPWVPNLPNWAFYAEDYALDEMYGLVPDGLDILVTHGPPFGYGDKTNMRFASDPDDFDGHVGSLACKDAIQRRWPRVSVFGHIHEGYGHYRIPVDDDPDSYANAYNVALNDENYNPVNPPVVIDL